MAKHSARNGWIWNGEMCKINPFAIYWWGISNAVGSTAKSKVLTFYCTFKSIKTKALRLQSYTQLSRSKSQWKVRCTSELPSIGMHGKAHLSTQSDYTWLPQFCCMLIKATHQKKPFSSAAKLVSYWHLTRWLSPSSDRTATSLKLEIEWLCFCDTIQFCEFSIQEFKG